MATLVFAVLELRQDISVEPYALNDPSDPFDQKFAITNNGPLPFYEVRHACAITYLQTTNPNLNKIENRVVQIMIPVAATYS